MLRRSFLAWAAAGGATAAASVAGYLRWQEITPVVNAPGLMLECGTLTWSEDRVRIQSPGGIADLAASIAEGVESWEKER